MNLTLAARLAAVVTTSARATTSPEESPRPRTAAPQARPRRSGLSVRVRITATVALLVLIALALAGLVVYVVEAQRLNELTVTEADRLLDSQDAGQGAGSGAGSGGQQATTLSELFAGFSSEEVTTGDHLLVGWTAAGPETSSTGDALLDDADLVRAVQPLVAAGGTLRLDSREGPLLVSTRPVSLGGRSGALVVISNLSENREYLRDTVRTYTIVSALSFLGVVLVASWQSGRLLSPLRTLRRTADEINATDLSRRVPERGNDDISALTRTVNGMLARLDAAFVGQREFLDDAGHELKTPLTVLRGHLELLDAGDVEEVAETRALLLDEVDRMARLVGDLILLAKSERPDFLTLAPTDVEHLTRTVLAKATGLGERRWLLDGVASVRVPLDEQRITQALLQLAHNAVKHTGPQDVVALGSSADTTGVHLWVRDTGPGVPVADRERVFERFGRSDVADDDEGFGLGLSIVAAIAQAHGGDARLDPDERGGARVVVDVPGTPEPTEPTHEEAGSRWPAS